MTTLSGNLDFNFTETVPNRFKFSVDNLLEFLFPPSLQHPLVAGRLFAYAFYGPLDNNGHLKTGFKQSRILADYELEAMCLQFEKEDIIQIYLQRSRDMGLLTNKEQEMIVAQADGHLKAAKGKSMLPALTKHDIHDLLKVLEFAIRHNIDKRFGYIYD